MLEFFVIFSKSGIVLFATVNQSLNQVVNGLVKHVFLEERTGQYQTDLMQLKYLLDNEFELVFVVGYQKFLQLSYVDKFLSDVQRAFRDKFSDFDLKKILNLSFNKQRPRLTRILTQQLDANNPTSSKPSGGFRANKKLKALDFCDLIIDEDSCVLDFGAEFASTYEFCVKTYNSLPKQESMRTFQDSSKSKKTIASMIVQPGSASACNNNNTKTAPAKPASIAVVAKPVAEPVAPVGPKPPAAILAKLAAKQAGSAEGRAVNKKAKRDASGDQSGKRGKAARQWDLGGSNPEEFDFSKKPEANGSDSTSGAVNSASMSKNIASALGADHLETNLDFELSDSSDDEGEDEDEENEINDDAAMAGKASKSSYFGSLLKTISYNKTLSDEDLTPVLDQLRDHLTAKNVAASIAQDLCDSVRDKLKGQHINTWVNLKKFTKAALEDAILGILNPGKDINILREIQAKPRPPYVIVFCGVNGVGKSTNLAKIANWLINNSVKVLVVACDTFRAGAIEQLRTHVMALKSLHEKGKDADVKIELFERGYKRDSAAIAMEAINYARLNKFNCVMVDTAGRMQDNEPLMRQLAKLISINTPDLTLFVGEALVGNEAVDQLTKFNDSLFENGCRLADSTKSAINGIVLTKFDTIDDQVGAAISMTYVTCKPIVFVGVGQTYKDLKKLDAKAVLKALMR